jgi:hypothetical protein
MADYQLVASIPGMMERVQRRSDGAFIPADPANRDYQAFLEWVEAGNTPDPAPPPSPAGAIADSAQSLQLQQAESLAAQGRTDEALQAVISILGSTP